MAGFLYGAPVATQPTLDDVRAWGLGYAFSKSPSPREVQGAPWGRGFVFADSKRCGDRIKLEADEQVWRKIPGRDGLQDVWVGYWKDAKPTPADLARADMLDGYTLTLADGNEWQIPVVRAFDEDTGKALPLLPSLYDLDEQGQLTRGEIAAAHRWLWDLTEPAWDAMIGESEVSEQSMLPIASKVIGANYVVDVVELAAMLQVFSPQLSPMGIVSLAIDYTTWKSWADSKKKTLSPPPTDGDSSLSNGRADSPRDTPQLAATS